MCSSEHDQPRGGELASESPPKVARHCDERHHGEPEYGRHDDDPPPRNEHGRTHVPAA